MAKKAVEKTAIQIAADKARDAFRAANEKAKLSNKPDDIAAATAARKTMDDAIAAERRDRFVRVGGGRVGSVIAAIKTLGTTTAQTSYSYSQTDIDKAFNAIEKELLTARTAMSNALTQTATTTTGTPSFQF